MTKKQKFWKIFGISAGITFPTLMVAWMFYDPFLAPRMVKYYSDDRNFNYYTGIISESYKDDRRCFIKLKDIEPKGDRYHLGYRYRIFSFNLEQTWAALNPKEDLEISFCAALRIFYDGGECAIIQISVNGEEILNYNEGKEALIEWAKTVH